MALRQFEVRFAGDGESTPIKACNEQEALEEFLNMLVHDEDNTIDLEIRDENWDEGFWIPYDVEVEVVPNYSFFRGGA